jgi:hypothetical protein
MFETIVGISEPTKELMNSELKMFRMYQVDEKDIKIFFSLVGILKRNVSYN